MRAKKLMEKRKYFDILGFKPIYFRHNIAATQRRTEEDRKKYKNNAIGLKKTETKKFNFYSLGYLDFIN
jgi:hypothetical protein